MSTSDRTMSDPCFDGALEAIAQVRQDYGASAWPDVLYGRLHAHGAAEQPAADGAVPC